MMEVANPTSSHVARGVYFMSRVSAFNEVKLFSNAAISHAFE
jgi:hypothetical protein